MGTKRTKQYTKEELQKALIDCDNDLTKLKTYLCLNDWSLRNQLQRHGLYEDKRKYSNKKRSHDIPDKELLENLYHIENLTLLEIGERFGVSNVTVKKWMVYYDIKLLTHSQTISRKVVPKIIQYNQTNYGYDHFFGSDEGKNKVAEVFLEKYGVPYHPIGNVSNSELEVLDFFNSLKPVFVNTRIFGIELDGYNDDLKIGFEYCGLFWHKESIKGKDLHYKKYKICKDNGIRLFTIFEDEWINRQVQVKSFIRSALGCNTDKLFARKLSINILDGRNLLVNDFIDRYHIQGKPNINNSIKHFTLSLDDDIYSVMSFSIHHRNSNETVLSRYCVRENYSIIGGAQRLFNHALKYFNCNIKTWSDNRWTEGNMYERLGFILHKELPKDYSYIAKMNRINKQKMKKKLILANDNQTEYERALEIGFDRIWDCGKKTWIYYK